MLIVLYTAQRMAQEERRSSPTRHLGQWYLMGQGKYSNTQYNTVSYVIPLKPSIEGPGPGGTIYIQ